MSRNVNTVILCEDRQHEAFARRFLMQTGKSLRVQRVVVSPKGRGLSSSYGRGLRRNLLTIGHDNTELSRH